MHGMLIASLSGSIDLYEVEDYLGYAMNKYDENREVPEHILLTRSEVVQQGFDELDYMMNNNYPAWEKDPLAFLKKYGASHTAFISQTLPALHHGSIEEIWQYTVDSYNYATDPMGNVLSTMNPYAKWDYWNVGGKFTHLGLNVNGNGCGETIIRREDLKSVGSPSAMMMSDGIWVDTYDFLPEQATGLDDDETEKMNEKFDIAFHKALKDMEPDSWLIVVDYHF